MGRVAHSHRAVPDGDVEIGGRVRVILLGLLAFAAVATVIGLVALWPDHDAVDRVRAEAPYAARGVTTPDAEVLAVGPACPADGSAAQPGASCDTVHVKVLEGPGKGDRADVQVPPEVTSSGIGKGDHLELFRTPGKDGGPPSYSFS